MDIEGFEFSVFEDLDSWEDTLLPKIISFELHIGRAPNWRYPGGRREVIVDLVVLFARLFAKGYVLISREDNPLCIECVEFTLVKPGCLT